MIVKLLGIMDLIAAVMFFLLQWDIWVNFGMIIAVYLIVKSLIFLSDFTSWIDLLAGVYMLLVIFGISSVFAVIFILWLLQKAFFSLLS